uniref:non-specific serine/threonine protein kinase n=1 Tax=Leersia perrieri TaxID=77586 RepID=A0A0D9XRR0_9ORYZ
MKPIPLLPSMTNRNIRFCILYIAVFAVVLLLLSFVSPAGSCSEQDSRSLLQFLAGLSQDGGLTTSWRPDVDCCTAWEGVSCGRDGMVTKVSLPSRGLHGCISPLSVANLTSLTHLNLSDNALSGSLPPELMSSLSLLVIDVSFNHLDGVLLLPWPMNTGLKLPLQVLNISSNRFAGEFPSNLSWNAIANLVMLNASNNSFTGEMPIAPLCNGSPSSSLAVLDLSDNRFNGEVSPEIASCSMLKVLNVAHNKLTGILPIKLFDVTSLEHLSFADNDLQGEIDGAHITKLTNLVTPDLGENSFHGEISESIGQLKKLEELRLDNNYMSGDLPSSLGNCTCLTTIDLKINKFSGDLGKVDFTSLHNLKILDVMRNIFSGVIPESIYSCKNLTALRISSNHMHGKIPVWLAKLKKLKVLDLSNNQLTSPMPSWINSLSNLFYLDVSNNSLTGNIPVTLMAMPMLESDNYEAHLTRLFDLPVYRISALRQYLALTSFPALLNISTNKFTGVIPQDIGQLSALSQLDFSRNKLHGEIPPAICNLTKLQVLDLSSNYLTGPIPEALNKLNFLSEFNISNNDLEGPIPTGGQMSTFSSSSFVGNPKLCGSILANCNSVKAAPTVLTTSGKQCSSEVISVIAFGVFFGVGVLYDQLVLSNYLDM